MGPYPTHRLIRSAERPLRPAFSLVELLTVMFIIGLLIGILIPSLNAARNAAKQVQTKSVINALSVGLNMFKNDHGEDFVQTNGYPPSFAHPRLVDANGTNIVDPTKPEFPFRKDKPVVYGAHWLPAMLMGVDGQGYISRTSLPKAEDLRDEPWRWYSADPFEDGSGKTLDRSPLYVETSKIRTLQTVDLPGIPNKDDYFPDWKDEEDPDDMSRLRVFVDAFDQPILYYASNRGGRPTNLVADQHDPTGKNEYAGGTQQEGPPFYFHQDNVGFTGTGPNDKDGAKPGWDLRGGDHAIKSSGHELDARTLALPFDPSAPEQHQNFARFIIDQTILKSLEGAEQPNEKTPLRPVNPDTFLLIAAGVDGRYGTADDVVNFER